MKEAFNYHSEQVHQTLSHGTMSEQRNIVNIQNGKGTKTVIKTKNGETKKSTHKLRAAEIKKIRKQQFVPNLFKPCYDCLRPKSSSRSRTQKKKGNQ
jgi:hypothetical protein